jgi:hypothetical protein
MSISIGGGITGGIGGISGGISGSIGLNPVFGLTASGGFNIAPPPAVLQWPGVPTLTGGFGASLGITGAGVNVNASAGLGGGFGGLTGSVGVGIGGSLNAGIGGSLGGSIGGNVSASLTAGITGSLSGGIGPLTGGVSLSPFGLSLSASLGGFVTADITLGMFTGPRWGIFNRNGLPVAPWETVIKIDYRREMRVAEFPIEDGGFASYNKVAVPYDVRISFVVGSSGGAARRTQLLAALEAAVNSLELFTVVTPEALYYSANLTHLEYARESRRGVNLLVVDVWVKEVRIITGASFTNEPKSPTSEPANNNGQTQPTDAPPGTDPGPRKPPDRARPSEDPPPVPPPADPPPGPTPVPDRARPSEDPPPPAMPAASAPPQPREEVNSTGLNVSPGVVF